MDSWAVSACYPEYLLSVERWPFHSTTGSLRPAFAPARPVRLAVKHPLAFSRRARFPTALRVPSRSSVTLWEETAPVKLPTMHGPCPRFRGEVRTSSIPGWYFKVGSTPTGVGASRSISTGRLHASRRVHRPPIHVVVFHGPSGVSRTRERSSWGRFPA